MEMEGAQPGHEADYSLPHLNEANNTGQQIPKKLLHP